jgi:hypothetical protein
MKPTEREAARSFRPWRGRTFVGSPPSGLGGGVGFAIRRLKPAATHSWPLPGPATVPSIRPFSARFSHHGQPLSAVDAQNMNVVARAPDLDGQRVLICGEGGPISVQGPLPRWQAQGFALLAAEQKMKMQFGGR